MFGINIGIVDFSVNGMETAFMVFFIACIIYTMGKTITAPSLALGASWAGLMWTRPDGFVYIIGLALGYLLFYPVLGKTRSRTHLVKIYFFAGFILLVLYLPWTIWTWSYYKTIVPHTVIAKGLNTAFSPENIPLLLKSGMDSISKLGFRYFYSSLKSLYPTFMPPWYSYGDWGGLPWYFSKPLAFIAAYYWILPFAKPQIRAISFATWLGHLYLTYFANVAPWYIPSVTLLTIIVLSGIIQQAIARSYFLNQWLASAQKIISYAIASGIFLISLFLFLAGAYQLRLQQEIIETGHRKNIGLWLKGHANTSKDTVFLEPLGYIGFYSQLKMYDWPGLSSPEMILARKKIKIKESFGQLIEELKPDWLVLRPHEIEQVKKDTPILLETYYHIPKIFDVSDKIMAYKFLPGRGYLEFDQTFTVFRKNGI
ncbi:MAG: hypothetical protein ABIG46_08190 [Candidatus Omnitrophota bacterium]|nr:hypothetical protein [Candidatus Omnitrophota bacterium]